MDQNNPWAALLSGMNQGQGTAPQQGQPMPQGYPAFPNPFNLGVPPSQPQAPAVGPTTTGSFSLDPYSLTGAANFRK